MKELEEQHVCVWKYTAKFVEVLETFQLVNQAYGEDCVSRTQRYEWFKHFKEGLTFWRRNYFFLILAHPVY